MAVQFNTFAALLLAFPFYLAQKGKLAKYIDLAKPGKNSANVQATGTAASTNSGAGSPNGNPAVAGNSNGSTNWADVYNAGSDYLMQATGLDTVLSDAVKYFG